MLYTINISPLIDNKKVFMLTIVLRNVPIVASAFKTQQCCLGDCFTFYFTTKIKAVIIFHYYFSILFEGSVCLQKFCQNVSRHEQKFRGKKNDLTGGQGAFHCDVVKALNTQQGGYVRITSLIIIIIIVYYYYYY